MILMSFVMSKPPSRRFGLDQDHLKPMKHVVQTTQDQSGIGLGVSQTAKTDEALRPPRTDPKKPEANFHGTRIGLIAGNSFSMVCIMKK